MNNMRFMLFLIVLCLGSSPYSTAQENSEVNYIWAKQAGGPGYDHGHCLAIDSSNNVYITGFFEETALFEKTSLSVNGNNFSDIFLAKYNYLGELVWVRQMGGNELDEGLSVTVDNNDNIYISGYFSSHADFGEIVLSAAGDRDIFLAKYDADGNVLWARRAGGAGEDRGYTVKTDSTGCIYIAGSFKDTALFTEVSLTASGGSDIFLAKYNSEGDLIWAKQAGGPGYEHAYSIAVNQQGCIYLTGYFKDTAVFGEITLTSYGDRDIFVAKYESNGNCSWVKQGGGIYWDYGYSLTVDPENNIIVTGFFYKEAVFDHLSLTAAAQNDIFLAKYDPDGSLIWVKQAGGPSYDRGKALITDSAGNIYVTGHFKLSTQFEDTQLFASNQYYNIFISKFDSSGNFIWATKLGADGLWNDGSSIALDSFGNIFITGSFTCYDEPMTLNNISLFADHFDVFITKIGKVKKKIIFK